MTPTAGMYFRNLVAGGGGSGHGFYRTLTIDHTQAGAADATDFPVLVSLTNASLKTVANGGKVQNGSGFDIGFFSDAGITTRLKHEAELYVPSTGQIIYHVKVPTISHTVDTVIYMAYGDTGITTDQSDTANVWTNSFARVVHAGDGSSASGVDSVSAANFTVTNATAGTGQIYGADTFAWSTNQYLKNTAAAVSAVPLTISAWAKLTDTSFAASEDRIIAAIAKTSALEEFWFSYFNNSGTIIIRSVAQGSGSSYQIQGTLAATDTNWHLLHGTWSNTSTGALYQDGAALSAGVVGSPQTPAGLTDTYIGALFFNTSSFYGPFKGLLDEIRIATVARSADWITLEYNNQKTGSTLLTVGGELTF